MTARRKIDFLNILNYFRQEFTRSWIGEIENLFDKISTVALAFYTLTIEERANDNDNKKLIR